MRNFIDEAIVHGVLIASFSVYGYLRSFSFAVVVGIVSVLLIHYRRDFLPERKQDVPHDTTKFEFEFEQLKERVNQLNALIAFKQGIAGRQAPQGVAPVVR